MTPADDHSRAGRRGSRLQRLAWTGERGTLRVWAEVLYVGSFYWLYSKVRNMQGSARDAHGQALTNATRILRWERWVGTAVEERTQQFFLGWSWFLQALNTWYGTAHFAVTLGALAWNFKRRQPTYRAIRNALAAMTALALIGFAFFPLMPPRLLPPSYGFVDTLKVYGGPWSFDSGAIAKLSNQYAAMPSLHIGWSTWCVYALWSWPKRRSLRWLLPLYPLSTLLTIVVTGNHYWFDALGGLVVFGLGVVIGRALAELALVDRVRMRRTAEPKG